jgi:hypothetical protein
LVLGTNMVPDSAKQNIVVAAVPNNFTASLLWLRMGKSILRSIGACHGKESVLQAG